MKGRKFRHSDVKGCIIGRFTWVPLLYFHCDYFTDLVKQFEYFCVSLSDVQQTAF
jgi:hypothetical protein